MKALIIKRGVVIEQTYRFYEPKAGFPCTPDYTKPIDLTGFTIRFVISDDITGNDSVFSSGLTITPLDGKVDVLISSADTLNLPLIKRGTAYLKLTDGSGNVRERAHRTCIVRD